MSLLDNDLVNRSPLTIPKPIGKSDTIYQFERLKGKENLSSLEAQALRSFYARTLLGKGLFALVPTLMERNVIVSISAKKEFYNDDEWANPYYPQKGGIPIILGQIVCFNEYDEIVLYITNIRTAAKDFIGESLDELWDLSQSEKYRVKSSDLLLAVFVHEMYHAYFHHMRYVKDVEEPMAEFGSLLYMNKYFEGSKNSENRILGLHRMIRQKEENEAIKIYGLGAKLFLRTSLVEKADSIINLIEEYKDAKENDLASFASIINRHL